MEFRILGPLDEAWSRLLLAEVLLGRDKQTAEQELRTALPVFDRLGSVREVERARASLAEIPAATG
jgi:hypothetical protein